MERSRLAPLRLFPAFAVCLTLAAGWAGACAAQSQAGDPDAYQGRYLSWAGKTPARAPAAQAPQPRPASAANYRRAPAAWNQAAPEERFAPENRLAPESDAMAPAPPPRVMADQGEASADVGPPASAGRPGDTHVRFYSVDRPYGLQPDPDPAPTQRNMVLIGPPAHTADLSQEDAAPDKAAPAKQRKGDAADDGDDPEAGGD